MALTRRIVAGSRMGGMRTVVRAARPEDAPALGLLMVESWLAAHREQIPDTAWQARAAEWTPEASAHGWAALIADIAATDVPADVLLVAEDDSGAVVGLVHGVVRGVGDGPPAGEISSLYVAHDQHRRGVGTSLLKAAAQALRDLDAVGLRLSVLTANLPARAFYEARGGQQVGPGTTDEDGHLLPTTLYAWSDGSLLGGD
ncbi:GNAT family N-acetyltransferase [Nocardioides alpinus]|uniref:GNAT family N-acetyltransferase n=1 Tax=Nocardioides alpinus TaxID=748909 RepID=UPI0012FEDFF3|nr:GNAT family N-acetyltransferase [Nocardioides alpinus]